MMGNAIVIRGTMTTGYAWNFSLDDMETVSNF